MKKYFRLLVIFLAFSCLTPHITSAQVVNVPDPNLAVAVCSALGLAPNAPITIQAIQRLTDLEAINRQIKDLTGLEHATQLTNLRLRSNLIWDVSPLAGLTRLKALIIDDNQISDVNPLAGLTQLVTLALNSP